MFTHKIKSEKNFYFFNCLNSNLDYWSSDYRDPTVNRSMSFVFCYRTQKDIPLMDNVQHFFITILKHLLTFVSFKPTVLKSYSFLFLFQLYEISDDPKRKEFLDDLFSFMQRRGKWSHFMYLTIHNMSLLWGLLLQCFA